MKLKFWLLAIVLLFFAGCIGTEGTIKSAVPSDLRDANVCSQGLWGDWLAFSLLGCLLGFFVVAFIYMVGEIAQKPDLVVGAKDDFYQTAVSLIIVANVAWMTVALCSEIGPQLLGIESGELGIGGLYDASFSYLNWLNGELITGYLHTFILYWRASLAASFVEGASPGGIGVNLSPFGGIGSLVSGLTMVLNALTIAWITNLVQIEVLKFVMLTSLTVWLPLGVVCRCFKPTRRFGGALMALGLGLFFFYPIEIGINAAIARDYTTELAKDFKERGRCDSAGDCCSNARDACVKEPLERGIGEPCDKDIECYSQQCVGGRGDGSIQGLCAGLQFGKKSGERCSKNEECFSGKCAGGSCVIDKGWCKPCLVSGKTGNKNECCTGILEDVPQEQGGGKACRACYAMGEPCRSDDDCCASRGGSQSGVCEGYSSFCSRDSDCDSGTCDTNTRTCVGVCSDRYKCEFDIGVGKDSSSMILKNSGGLALNAVLSNVIPIIFMNLLRLPFSTGIVYGLAWSAGILAVLGIAEWFVLFYLLKLVVTLFVVAFILPTINFLLIINLVRDLSKFLGEEMDISNLTRMI